MKQVAKEKIDYVKSNLDKTDDEIAKVIGIKAATVAKIRESASKQHEQVKVGQLQSQGRAMVLTEAQSKVNDNIRRQATTAASNPQPGSLMDGISVLDPSKPIH